MTSIEEIMKKVREDGYAENASFGQLTLGGLIDALRAMPQDAPAKFDFGAYPADAESYRGYYEQLSFNYSGTPVTVADVLREAQEACGQTMMGYKGGDFVMHRGTWVWASQYGRCDGYRVTGVKNVDGEVIIWTEIAHD